MAGPTISTEQNAADVIADLATADREQAQGVLAEESAKEKPRTTVVAAAQERLEVLDIPGEPQEEEPEGAWAQLLDGDGEPVLVDGLPVKTVLIP